MNTHRHLQYTLFSARAVSRAAPIDNPVLLNIWYHNLALRKILYSLPLSRDVEADKPLFELQKLFANLQLSSESFVDTAPLLESLRLSRDDQQDVQEFFLLFLATLEKKVEAIDRY
ncbi:hypothetical protein SARC_06411, partial [Sphaeroforma arctica JP610]